MVTCDGWKMGEVWKVVRPPIGIAHLIQGSYEWPWQFRAFMDAGIEMVYKQGLVGLLC